MRAVLGLGLIAAGAYVGWMAVSGQWPAPLTSTVANGTNLGEPGPTGLNPPPSVSAGGGGGGTKR